MPIKPREMEKAYIKRWLGIQITKPVHTSITLIHLNPKSYHSISQ